MSAMWSETQRFRWLSTRLPGSEKRRIVVLTGARQTGKTTLARKTWPDLLYLNLDDLEERERIREVAAPAWGRTVGPGLLDEAQKEPSVFEKVKFAFDAGELDFSVLLGSSQILLLKKVRETLAGRTFLYELWPLMPSEIRSPAHRPPPPPLLDKILKTQNRLEEVLEKEPQVLTGRESTERKESLAWLALWGGMPELLRLSEEDRRLWLRSFRQTFLERDLSDLARLSDLDPFQKLQRLAMLRTGCILSHSELARDGSLSPSTVRRYLEYLRISYQVTLLPPWRTNLTSRIVKSPKLYWCDLGILRQATRQWGPLTGPLFETLVVSEIQKWCSTMALDVELFFYRTRSGMEVDLLVETSQGILGFEIKKGENPGPGDFAPLRKVAQALGERWLGGAVIYGGEVLRPRDRAFDLWEIPAHYLF